MAHTCSECTYMDFSKEYDNDGKFWCETKYEWHYADEAECWRYCKAYSRSSSTAKSYYDYSKSKQSSSGGCFITTIVCEILGFKDDGKVLNSLRNFRDEVMHKDEKYNSILLEYDIIGPIIAHKIREDEERDLVAKALFISTIEPVFDLIESGEHLKAVKLYKNMTNQLIEYYNINKQVSLELLNNMDVSKSGHGRFEKVKK